MNNNYNNNVEISGLYRIDWWRQPQDYSQYQTFLSKLGFDPELICQNQNLIHLNIEMVGDGLRLKFSRDFNSPVVTEDILPGAVVRDEAYEAVWYR